MRERLTPDGHPQIVAISKIEGRLAPGWMLLEKVNFLLRPTQRPPFAQEALQRAHMAGGKTARMTPFKLAQQRARFQQSPLIHRQQWHDLAVEHLGKRIAPGSPAVWPVCL